MRSIVCSPFTVGTCSTQNMSNHKRHCTCQSKRRPSSPASHSETWRVVLGQTFISRSRTKSYRLHAVRVHLVPHAVPMQNKAGLSKTETPQGQARQRQGPQTRRQWPQRPEALLYVETPHSKIQRAVPPWLLLMPVGACAAALSWRLVLLRCSLLRRLHGRGCAAADDSEGSRVLSPAGRGTARGTRRHLQAQEAQP